jgi:WD40 repeat protein
MRFPRKLAVRMLWLSVVVLSLVGLSFSGWRVAAGRQAAASVQGQDGLAYALNADRAAEARNNWSAAEHSLGTQGSNAKFAQPSLPTADPVTLRVAAPLQSIKGYVYVNTEGSVVGYAVDALGNLQAVLGSPYPTVAGSGSNCDVMTATYEPGRRVLYVSNPGQRNISAFTVNIATGQLTPVPGSPFALTSSGLGSQPPAGLAIDATKSYLYAGRGYDGSFGVEGYAIAANGALSLLAGSPFHVGVSQSGFTLLNDPVENTIITSSNGPQITILRVGAGGALTPIGGSPFNVGCNIHGLALHSTRRELAVGDASCNVVRGFPVLAGGGLGTQSAAFSGPSTGVQFTPDGSKLYAGTFGNNIVYGFNVAAGPVFSSIAGSPFPSTTVMNVALSSDGTLLFTNGNGTLRSFTLDAAGQPTSADAESFPRGGCASGMVFVPIVTTTTATSSLGAARYIHTATLLQNGKVLVAGGHNNSSGNLASAELYDPATGTWSATGSLTVTRLEHTATLLPNGKVLVAGGKNDGGVHASAELYDPVSGTWSATGSLNTARFQHTATLLANGKVLVVGGQNSGGSPASAELYDPATGAWSTTGNLAAARFAHTATLLSNGKVLVAGGNNGSALASSELYDPAAGTWSNTGSLAAARFVHTATLLPNGKVLVAAGHTGSGRLASAELYDPVAGTWSATGNLNAPRSDHTATLLPNGKVLVAAGFGSSAVFASAELYDPAAGTWSAIGNLNAARYVHTATLLANGKVLVAGGHSGSAALASAELYDYPVGSWGNTTSLSAARYVHTATLLPTGKALIAGGYNDTVALASAELYDPATGTWSNTGSLGAARLAHTATLLSTGKLLVAGGDNISGYLASAELYDPATGMWSNTGSFSTARNHHTATLLPNGKVLIAGGEGSSGGLTSAELYDPATGMWSATGNLGAARHRHTATLLPNGKVLVAGGVNGGTSLASAELYDPATGMWSATGSLVTTRYFQTATLLPNGKLLVVGGYNGAYLTSAELYNPATGTWSTTGSLNTARYLHKTTLLPNGKVLTTGGHNLAPLASAELYDPAAETWSATSNLPSTRYLQTLTLLPNGKVLIAGGNGNAPTASAELYNIGLGFQSVWQPSLSAATSPLLSGNQLAVSGTQFKGISEASGGDSDQNSSTNYPLVQLRSLTNEQSVYLPVSMLSGWSDTAFTSTPITVMTTSVAGFPLGHALVTVFTNAIPSSSRIIQVGNTPPTISAGGPLARQQGSAGASSTIATVGDIETLKQNLVVTVLSAPKGINITSISAPNASTGEVTATVAVACDATLGNNTVVLQVMDGNGATTTANLIVNVTANSAPTVGTYTNTALAPGGGATVTPAATPSDNGTIASVTAVAAPATFTGTLMGNTATGAITISNANPAGSYTITVTVTDNCGATATRTFTLTVNTAPTITAEKGVTRQQGSPASSSQIATAMDVEDAETSLVVTVNGGTSATTNGVTVSGISVNALGQVMASVAANCTASEASFMLTVTDTLGATANTTLTVTITTNSAPAVGNYANTTVLPGSSGTIVTPTAAPADNGSIASVTAVAAPATFTGAFVGNTTSGAITINNAGPAGSYTVTVTVADNCGATVTRTFTLTVNTAPTITATKGVSRQQDSPTSNSQIATATDAEDAETALVVTVNGSTSATSNGVTVNNLTINATGQVFANVLAGCAATNANFTLAVTDTLGGMANTTLSVTVTANTAPTVGTYVNTTIVPGGGATVTPNAALADNGTIASLTAAAPGFGGTFTGNTTTGAVTISSANPPGSYTVTVTVTDNCGATTTRTFTLTVNSAPTITAMAASRQQGSPTSNSQVATALDAEAAENSLTVTVDGGASATTNGVTVSNLTVNAAGQVTANVVASCTAINAGFTLTVTDTLGATANATLNVTVTANAQPTAGTYPNTVVAPGGSAMVTPTAAPADNGSIASVTATATPNNFTGTFTGNTATGALSITNAGPMGGYNITVTITDNCGVSVTRTFMLTVSACGATLSKTSQSFAANGGSDSFTVTIDAGCPWTAVSNNPSFITVNTPMGTSTSSGTVSYTVGSHSNTSARSGTITVAGQTFTVLQGAQFLDVPVGAPLYTEIGKLSARGVTLGCGGGNYCPNASVTREQLAAFIIRALGDFNPQLPTMQRFNDVPLNNPFSAFIEQMAVRQITLGCGGGNYCLTQNVTREQIAALLIRALHAPGYVPPAPTMQRFTDVPPSHPFYAHIEELAVRGITLGCGGGNYCPTGLVTRGQVAAFLVRAFNL